ncbi:DASS family sodium-coupled anion symporter [Vibrio cincinnatiensis]|jgi:sodium-dependent dicarboxylate transporter 2/3/5|uniref:Solute carrier family 13 (Sodium-dependent dicarboxylate transporter), member 2/3/5 n=1 Tax=Vibrio cincinnatiensis DSM 19608 TaxID=1123491 RepID=A0A1T4NNM7_VIBCI|nr:DASS family sodium-coupled anion symporter [Vibrio cincinnatiensis]MCG3720977.1 DASS family sodium-coupled anion symporter [Vibrio cincinnatiensis]MCG3732806.1 DASS family sodium-coupled anion symporter [Vibrio cincinnatiensis]MCG3735615.1 DASS family sodium-coupled anion symporter [Vibrio cincinnatiensis]MCG3739031.1 DASS family sodium-coupled anion symporter [Vibrio cincinnatiensis]MCG3741913.1 DASS family sodium-coupled anion symporter [Vibrio cincinnatiensis]
MNRNDSVPLPNNTREWLLNRNSLIVLADIALFFILLNVLPFDPNVVLGLSILVFIAILWLTEALHVTVTAILVPIMAVIFGVFETQAALNNFANSVIFLFLGGFALAAAMHRQGLDKVIADKVLLMARGRFSVAVFMLFGVTAALSMWISNTATAAMMLPLVLGILSKVDQDKGHNTYVFVLLGIAYSASIGGIATMVGSPPNAIAAAQVGLSFSEWMKFGIPTTIIMLPIAVILLYLLLKPNLSGQFELNHEVVDWDKGKVVTLAIFALTVALWIFSKPVNAMLGGFKSFDTIIALGAIILVSVARVVHWKDIEKTADWGVLLLFGGGICLSNILRQTGTSLFLANELSALISDLNILFIIIAIAAFVVFLTEFASNTASAALLIPVFAGIAEVLGVSPIILSVLIAIAASCAFMLPVATPPNAIVFATGHIKQHEMMRVGMVLNIACIVILSAIAMLFWN